MISLCVIPGLESIPVILKCLQILAQAPVLYFSPILVDQPSEAEFLDVTGTKVLRVFLLAIHSHLY
jgi:hypothetical protein